MEATELLAWLKVVAIMMILVVMMMMMMMMPMFVIVCTARIPWRLLDYLLG